MIGEYHFGSITIDGKTYNHDVQVFPTNEVRSWWRKTSHEIALDDIGEALAEEPEIIIFGTGSPGLMKVFDETKEKIKSLGIELIIEPTEKAVKKFNGLEKTGKRVIALFHLTC